MSPLPLIPGVVVTREEMKELFGGSTQGGIIPSRSTPTILLYTDHASGKRYGYQDGWVADEDDSSPIFEYTGEGTRGDQTLKSKNGSLLRHADGGRDLHVFVAEGYVPGTETRTHRYVGSFTVDRDNPYAKRQVLDSASQMRWAYIFRLRPVGNVDQVEGDMVPLANTTTATPLPATPMTDPAVRREAKVSPTTCSKAAKPETNSGGSIFRKPIGPLEVKRREAELSDRFLEFLEKQGHTVGRFKIRIKGLASVFFTDLYDETDKVLYEIKSKTDRKSVREAIAQLIDYSRHIEPTDVRLAVLLPERPHDDLCDLVAKAGMTLIYEAGDGFVGWPVPLAT